MRKAEGKRRAGREKERWQQRQPTGWRLGGAVLRVTKQLHSHGRHRCAQLVKFQKLRKHQSLANHRNTCAFHKYPDDLAPRFNFNSG